MREEFRTGTSVAALAREHHVSRGAIRSAVADLMPGRPDRPVVTAVIAPQAVRVEIPGKIARHLHDRDDLGDTARRALRQGRTVRVPVAGLRFGVEVLDRFLGVVLTWVVSPRAGGVSE